MGVGVVLLEVGATVLEALVSVVVLEVGVT